MDMTRGMFNNKPVTDIESFVQLGDGKVVTGREEHEDSLKPFNFLARSLVIETDFLLFSFLQDVSGVICFCGKMVV